MEKITLALALLLVMLVIAFLTCWVDTIILREHLTTALAERDGARERIRALEERLAAMAKGAV